VCENIIPLKSERWFCSGCDTGFEFIKGSTCNRCGLPESKEFCNDCKNKEFYFNKNTSIIVYDDVAKHLIYKLKYGKSAEVGLALGVLMYKNVDPKVFNNIDYITCVPIHKSRKKIRGFNQAEILCTEISKRNGIITIKDLIKRVKNTKPQSSFNNKQREENLKNAFAINSKYDIKGKRILIVDDIYTTGATLNRCASVLIQNGAIKVDGLNLCITLKKENNLYKNKD
jgi:competence protein ComFC